MLDELGQTLDPPVRSFALGRDRAAAAERLTGLERLGEKLARALRPVLEGLACGRVEVAAEPLAIRAAGEWLAEFGAFYSVSLYRLAPFKGGMMAVAVAPAFVAALLERFYGGSGGSGGEAAPRRREFSAGEELLLGRLLDRLIAATVAQWQDMGAVEAGLVVRDSRPAHLAFLRDDEAVVVQAFRVTPMDGAATEIAFAYPLAMLRAIEAEMALRVHEAPPAPDANWQRRLAAALAQVPLPIRSVLARPEISLAQLMTLKPGDVIPIRLAPTAPLLAADHPIAEGQMGEHDGRAALRIERLGGRR